jgi:phage terminase large subunit GpA-like protein
MPALATAATFVGDLWNRAFLPDQELTVDAWATTHRRLGTKETSEPGRWHGSRVPYGKKIMDTLSVSHLARLIVFEKGSQIAGSEFGLNWMGYVMDHAPGPMMLVLPTLSDARRFSQQRIDSMIAETAVLREHVAERRERDSGNSRLLKEFPGGMLVITGANAAAGLRSTPVRFLNLEEIDAYARDADDEGDPVNLAIRRTANFPRRKIFMPSTPKKAATSRVHKELLACEQVWDYHVPCPFCDVRQKLVWERITYDKPEVLAEAEDAEGNVRLLAIPNTTYRCAGCEQLIPEHFKTQMLARAATYPDDGWVARWNHGENSVGFHLSALYSPLGWFSWGEAAAMYEKALREPEQMQVFVNTVLGLPYAEAYEAPEWRRLYARRETFAEGEVPPGVVFLTGACDVQHNRLEVEIFGWARGKEHWSIAYHVIPGDPMRDELFNQLDEILFKDYPCAGDTGTLPIRVFGIDMQYASPRVYAWARKHPQALQGPAGPSAKTPRTVVCLKGTDREDLVLYRPFKVDLADKARGLLVWQVGGTCAKKEIYLWLRQERSTDEELAAGRGFPHGYFHAPMYDEEYFRQLTAERLVRRVRHGFVEERFEKDEHARNEVLDLHQYNRAAAAVFGVDRFRERHWQELEELLPPGFRAASRDRAAALAPRPPVDPPPATATRGPTPTPLRRRRGRPRFTPSPWASR